MGELSSEQVDYCEEVVIRPEPSCSGNCSLNLGVDQFSGTITHLMLVAVDDSIHMVSDGSSQPFEGRESGATCPADPLLQGLYWINARSCFSQYLSQPLFHPPGSGCLEARTLQPVHHFKLSSFQSLAFLRVPQRIPLRLLSSLTSALLTSSSASLASLIRWKASKH